MRKYFSSSSKQQQAGSSKKQATENISAYLHISISIDGTSPKFLWRIALLKVYKPTKFQGETYQGAGSVGKKVFKILKNVQARPWDER